MRGGIRRAGLLEANGAESIELTYNVIADFQIQPGEEIASFQEY